LSIPQPLLMVTDIISAGVHDSSIGGDLRNAQRASVGNEPLFASEEFSRRVGLRSQRRGVRLRHCGGGSRVADCGRHMRIETEFHARFGPSGRGPFNGLRGGLAHNSHLAPWAWQRIRSQGQKALPSARLRPALGISFRQGRRVGRANAVATMAECEAPLQNP